MDTVYFVDWLSVVYHWTWMNVASGSEPLLAEAELCGWILTGLAGWQRCKPRFGYSLAWREPIAGAVMQYSSTRPDMGVNIVLTGQTLRLLDWRAQLKRALEREGKVTRLDLTVDVRNPDFDLPKLYAQVERKEVETRARSYRFVTSNGGGTLYVGGRSSEKFLRIYDKGGEQGEQLNQYFRIELECKAEAARWVANMLAQDDSNEVLGVITGYFDAPLHVGWVLAMATAKMAIGVPSEKKRPDTEAWLMGMVARTMAAAERRRPGILDKFFDEVVNLL